MFLSSEDLEDDDGGDEATTHHPRSRTALVAQPGAAHPASSFVVRTRSYAFVLDARGMPIELGSGRSAKAYLGEERWSESKTGFRRDVVIKVLQKGVSEMDCLRFQMEKEVLERVQGHPNIVRLYASGEADQIDFVPESIRDHVEGEFLVLERLDTSLEEHLRGSREGKRGDLLALGARERLLAALDYVVPVASAVEFAHLARNVCHRDIKPANVLVGWPHPALRGAPRNVRLADFNTANQRSADTDFALTRTSAAGVPGTLFFQSPEQETNLHELLVTVQAGSDVVEHFEDFYIAIAPGDVFTVKNRGDAYAIVHADRANKRVHLASAYRGPSEASVIATVRKSVGRPADIYAIGALFYYLLTGACKNPKALYDDFHKFIEYEADDASNTIESYLSHQYALIESLRAPATDARAPLRPSDQFFSYKAFLDGGGGLLDPGAMRVVARCMIRNKSDSYCQAHDLETTGMKEVVRDLVELYAVNGERFGARAYGTASGAATEGRGTRAARVMGRLGSLFKGRSWG